ncbi:MAG: S9 family peptidase [Calditrichia bacterium]
MNLAKWVMLILLIIASFGWGERPIQFEDMFSMGRVSDPQISPDGKWIAYTITYYNLSDNSHNSDIYLVSADGSTSKQLTFSPKSERNPRWSPLGDELAFISDRDGSPQIYVLNLRGGEAEKITDIATAVGGFCWSPDGRYFAVETEMLPTAQSPEESLQLEEEWKKEKGSGREIENLLYRHWNSWREGKYNHVLLVERNGRFVRDLTPGAADTPPISLGSAHDYVFSPAGTSLCFVKNPDSIVAISTNNDLWVTPIFETTVQQITHQRGNDFAPHYSPDGNKIAYLSMACPGFEADQTNLFIYDLQSGTHQNLTETLDRSVEDFVWSPDGKKIYFYVAHQGRHRLYEVEIENRQRKLLLDNHYLNAIDISPDGKFLVLAHQKINMPTELFRFDIKNKKLTQLTFTNRERLAELEMNPLEDYWFLGANNDSVHLLLVKPPQFNPGKKYPMISLIHGGPQGDWGDDFHYRWNAQMFASPGYVVIMINFHGSRGYGQEFCDAVSKNWGGWPYEDILIGTRWAAENFSFIDKNRIGAAGASYGGFMINWIEGHNDDGLFKCLVSHDGVYEQVSMFGATEELWFPAWEFNGYPWQEGSLYQKWNPANFVAHFKTPMLIIHGEHDYRVPYTQGLQLFTALQLQGVESKLLFFPDEDHFVRKPRNARQWWQNVHAWLAKYLNP